MSAERTVEVNGVPQPIAPDDSLGSLVTRLLGESTRGIAVAVNGTVVPAGQWAGQPLAPGDQVEILTALQGG